MKNININVFILIILFLVFILNIVSVTLLLHTNNHVFGIESTMQNWGLYEENASQ